MHASESAQSAKVVRFQPRPAPGFTSRDLIELNGWETPDHRVEIDEAGEPLGQFAMMFQAGEPWASWAVSRDGATILVWDCVSLADIGRFETMQAALQAVPARRHAAAPATARTAEVIRMAALAG